MWHRWFRQWLNVMFWWVPRSEEPEDDQQAKIDEIPPEASHSEAPATDQWSTAAADGAKEPPPGSRRDDLTVIKGLGPAMQRKLEAVGITTFQQLASADAERLANQLKPSQRTLTKDNVKSWIDAARNHL